MIKMRIEELNQQKQLSKPGGLKKIDFLTGLKDFEHETQIKLARSTLPDHEVRILPELPHAASMATTFGTQPSDFSLQPFSAQAIEHETVKSSIKVVCG
ncbi:hypothetical protein SLEP1_g38291 [Rubroshorea leprosula]|uniref:Uncharacterized protein n=1 Tax=Rubroshorea leprosula TaxID=152421 RepID=A0AAV5KXK7_9ROSI|nr:hypothetical protein SLEP1_g38291 [Rubroshorea leprosula]